MTRGARGTVASRRVAVRVNAISADRGSESKIQVGVRHSMRVTRLRDIVEVSPDLWGPTESSTVPSNKARLGDGLTQATICLLYTSPSPRDQRGSRMPSSA